MSKKRAVIVYGDGTVNLADSVYNQYARYNGTPFNLDEAMQKGAKVIGNPVPFGNPLGTAIFLVIQEEPME